jgi:hypothetical protein
LFYGYSRNYSFLLLGIALAFLSKKFFSKEKSAKDCGSGDCGCH